MTADLTQDARMLTFIVATDDFESAGGDKGLFGSQHDEPRLVSVSVSTLKKNLRETLDGIKDVFDNLNEIRAELPLKEVQVSFEVTASGKVAILGTGAEVAGKGAITITFGK